MKNPTTFSMGRNHKTIKGYMPLRILFPSMYQFQDGTERKTHASTDSEWMETFLYVKPHQSTSTSPTTTNTSTMIQQDKTTKKTSSSLDKDKDIKTLFIVNVPFLPGIQSSFLLEYIFGTKLLSSSSSSSSSSLHSSSGGVHHVVVASNPKKTREKHATDTTLHHSSTWDESWLTSFVSHSLSLQTENPSEKPQKEENEPDVHPLDFVDKDLDLYQYQFYSPGKFAHVHFHSSKDMKRIWNPMIQLQNKGGLRLTMSDMDTLLFHSQSLYQEFLHTRRHHMGVTLPQAPIPQGIDTWVQSYQRSIPSRDWLQKACDAIISKYEQEEALNLEKQKMNAMGIPDEDGFITVSYVNSHQKNATQFLESFQKDTFATGDDVPTLLESSKKDVKDDHEEEEKEEEEEEDHEEEEEEEEDEDGPENDPNNTHVQNKTTKKKKRNKLSTYHTSRKLTKTSRGANRKLRKIVRGSDPLPDFYKFQSRESRKRNIDELKEKFQNDLKRVKEMKDEKMYRPF